MTALIECRDLYKTYRVGGATINALAVGGDLPLDHGTIFEEGGRLTAYFERHLIWGPGAFVESAEDYDDFERAMTRKLERELQPMLLGSAAEGDRR